MQEEQIDITIQELFKSYNQYWNSAVKKDIQVLQSLVKKANKSYIWNWNRRTWQRRKNYNTWIWGIFIVNCYTPNSKRELERLDYRMTWEDEIRKYLLKLDKIKPVIYCGDLNVAHKEIDLKNPKTNRRNAGFTDEERGKMTELLEAGFTDTFRYLYPDKENAYSWWSYMAKAREKI